MFPCVLSCDYLSCDYLVADKFALPLSGKGGLLTSSSSYPVSASVLECDHLYAAQITRPYLMLRAGITGGGPLPGSSSSTSSSSTSSSSTIHSSPARSRSKTLLTDCYELHEIDSLRTTPPVSHHRRPCFYMVQWGKDGLMYGGSTRGLKRRIAAHMKVTRGKEYKALKMAYAVVPDMSEAAQLEKQLVRRLEEAGVPMWSTHDGKKRSQA